MMFQNKTSDCSGQKLGRQFDASAKNSNKTKKLMIAVALNVNRCNYFRMLGSYYIIIDNINTEKDTLSFLKCDFIRYHLINLLNRWYKNEYEITIAI